MTQNLRSVPPAFLPSVPLPVGMVGGGMMYMYSCSQCDFKTHIEAMFKQHVDSVHLGLTNSANNIILAPQNMIGTASAAGGVAVNPVSVTATLAGTHMAQTLVVATPAPGTTAVASGLQKSGVVTLTTSPTGGLGGMGATTVHKCPKCGFLAPSKNQLTQHRRKFHGKAATVSYAQPVQGQLMTTSSSASAAGTNTTSKKTYTCSTCGYSTTRRDGLSQHYDSVHLKIKNHQCSLCPYAASQKGTLNRHVKLRHKKKDDILGQ